MYIRCFFIYSIFLSSVPCSLSDPFLSSRRLPFLFPSCSPSFLSVRVGSSILTRFFFPGVENCWDVASRIHLRLHYPRPFIILRLEQPISLWVSSNMSPLDRWDFVLWIWTTPSTIWTTAYGKRQGRVDRGFVAPSRPYLRQRHNHDVPHLSTGLVYNVRSSLPLGCCAPRILDISGGGMRGGIVRWWQEGRFDS